MDWNRDRPSFYIPQYPTEPGRVMPEYPGMGRDVPQYPAGSRQRVREYPVTGLDTPQYVTVPGRDERDLYTGIPAPSQMPWDSSVLDGALRHQNLEEELAQILSAEPLPTQDPDAEEQPLPRIDRRRTRPRPQFLDLYRRITRAMALCTVIAVCAVCLLIWSIAYTCGQLSETAGSVLPRHLAQWWPLMLYGPWSVAALSILRAAVQRHPARRSWGVLLVTSAVAVALCVSHSAHSALAFVTLGIPPITSLVCFWELVGQFTSGRRARPRGRRPRPSKV